MVIRTFPQSYPDDWGSDDDATEAREAAARRVSRRIIAPAHRGGAGRR